MFCDQTKITVIAGNGGDGAVSFHREKFVAHGPPDGGNGGKGGNIIFKAVDNLNTLSNYRTKKMFKGEGGDNGKKNNCTGYNGEDLILELPVGTVIFEDKGKGIKDKENIEYNVIADLSELGQEYLVVKGGRGGKGNASFVSSVRQAPSFAENGEPGEEKELLLELKLVADVGIIGMPSAGKSTLISRISAAKPKIADYPFTTLIPNLGVVDMKNFGGEDGQSFVVVDIPGLIEGAADGKGLGDEFLRHVTRAKFLIHLLDANLDDIVDNYLIINRELAKYSDDLAKKDQIVVINKIDLLDEELANFLLKQLEEANKKLKGKILLISAVTGIGLNDLIWKLWKRISRTAQVRSSEIEQVESHKVYTPHLDRQKYDFEITLIGEEKIVDEYVQPVRKRKTKKERMEFKKDEELDEIDLSEQLPVEHKKRKIFSIACERLEQMARMTNFDNIEAVDRIHDVMNKLGIYKALIKQAAVSGDKIVIAGKFLKFREL